MQIACFLQTGAALQGPLRRFPPTASVTDKPLPVDAPRGDIVLAAEPAVAVEAAPATYARGLATIGGITLIFASNSPVLHAATSGDHAPPVLLLNAACAVLALASLLVLGPLAAPVAASESRKSHFFSPGCSARQALLCSPPFSRREPPADLPKVHR